MVSLVGGEFGEKEGGGEELGEEEWGGNRRWYRRRSEIAAGTV